MYGVAVTLCHCVTGPHLDVELVVDDPERPARDQAPQPDGGVLAAGDHQL